MNYIESQVSFEMMFFSELFSWRLNKYRAYTGCFFNSSASDEYARKLENILPTLYDIFYPDKLRVERTPWDRSTITYE